MIIKYVSCCWNTVDNKIAVVFLKDWFLCLLHMRAVDILLYSKLLAGSCPQYEILRTNQN